jgi:NADH dehydrogenase (ubiquinone) Fe-S protein 6
VTWPALMLTAPCATVADDPALGCPVEYINLKGTTEEKPAVCKYTGNKYYSDDWKYGGHH